MTKKIVLRSILGLFSILILLLIFLPIIIRKTTIKNSKEWIGRSISLEKLKVNYFTGTATLIDFKLYEADDSAVFIGFDTLLIDTEPYRFIGNEIVIEQLYLKGLNIFVAMEDSSFNFDDLVAFHRSDTASTPKDTIQADPLRFELSNLELKDAFFIGKDVTLDKQMELSNIDFIVPYLSWDQEQKSEAGLRFDFKNGGYFQSNIDIDPSGGEFEANVTLKELDIEGYDDFISKYIDIGSISGFTDIEVNLAGNINKPEATKASGLLALNKFNLTDHDNKPLFNVDNLKVRLKEADPENSRYVVDSVVLTSPYIFFEMHDSTNNIINYVNHILPPEESTKIVEEKSIENTEDAVELYYALNNFIIEKGVIDIVDDRTGEPFKYHLSELSLETDSITSVATWIDSYANMLLNNRGKLVAQMGVNPVNPMDLTVDYTITDFMLSDLNIYSRHYMGFPILYGDMYYKAHTEILDGQITSENKLIIHNVELGNKGGGLYDLPLKFALFLLKDKDGVITLDVPVSGDLKDPQVSVGKIVWNTFKNLIIKAAAAPVKLLSGLIGADPNDIRAIEYEYLDTAFTEKKQKQLDLLLQLEQKKPDLEIELIYFNDPQLERHEIAVAEAGKMYDKKHHNKDYKADREAFEAFVLKEISADSVVIIEACQLLAGTTVIDSVANEFDKNRISVLSDYLKMANDSTEIQVHSANIDAPKNLGSKPVFEVKYGMKEENIE